MILNKYLDVLFRRTKSVRAQRCKYVKSLLVTEISYTDFNSINEVQYENVLLTFGAKYKLPFGLNYF